MKFRVAVIASLLVCGCVVRSYMIGTQGILQLEGTKKHYSIWDKVINKTLNSIIERIQNPIAIENFTFNVEKNLALGTVRLNLTAHNVTIGGLSDVIIKRLKVNPLSRKVRLVLEFGQFFINSKFYHFDLNVLSMPLHGRGALSTMVKGLTIDATYKIRLNRVTNVNASFNASTLQNVITGLAYNTDFGFIFESAVESTTSVILTKYNETVSQIISPIIESLINELIKKSNSDGSGKQFKVKSEVQLQECKLKYHFSL